MLALPPLMKLRPFHWKATLILLAPSGNCQRRGIADLVKSNAGKAGTHHEGPGIRAELRVDKKIIGPIGGVAMPTFRQPGAASGQSPDDYRHGEAEPPGGGEYPATFLQRPDRVKNVLKRVGMDNEVKRAGGISLALHVL
jgi:hypothetical protein